MKISNQNLIAYLKAKGFDRFEYKINPDTDRVYVETSRADADTLGRLLDSYNENNLIQEFIKKQMEVRKTIHAIKDGERY